MNEQRKQLTLFIEEGVADPIEQLRKTFNPLQYVLIKAHVTLCREDELGQMDQILANLKRLKPGNLFIDFGAPIRFAEGQGVLIPARGDYTAFRNLRSELLDGTYIQLKDHAPHITLMHPRNSLCTDELYEHIRQIPLPKRIEFKTISLIQQAFGQPWVTMNEFKLTAV